MAGPLMRQEFEVRGKRIRIIFLWNEYQHSTYNKDFWELADYQKKKLDVTTDLKFHNVKDLAAMPYPHFMELVERTMTLVIKKTLTDYPQAIVSQRGIFEVQIKIVRNENFEWYTNHEDSLAELNKVFIELNGLWLINNLAIPYQYKDKRVNFNLLYKFFVHEITHYIEKMKMKFRDEDYAREKHAGIIERNNNHALFYLYLAFENLRVEGFAEFREKSNMTSVQINMGWIRSFRPNLLEMIKHAEEEKAEEFFEAHFGAAAYAGNAYYCGRVMCYTIGLAILRRMPGEVRHIEKGNREYFLKKDRTKGFSILLGNKAFPITEIEKAMNSSTIFYATPLPEDIFKMAYNLISTTRYRQFIRLYEKACDDLGISEKNRVVTYAFFDRVKKEATNWHEKRRAARIKEKGFAATGSEEEEDIDEEPAPRNVAGSHAGEKAVNMERAVHNGREHHAEPEKPQAHETHEPHEIKEPATVSQSDSMTGLVVAGVVIAAIVAALIFFNSIQ